MKESLSVLATSIDYLVDYIENQKKSKMLLNKLKNQDSDFKDEADIISFNTPIMRVFEYNCYIISLYGYFEQFIESILTEYIDSLASLHVKFNDLPNEIKKNNIRKNTELLNNLKLPKYQGIQDKIIIEVLHDNMINDKSKINTIAFSHHSTNFRIIAICEYFKSVGVNDLGKAISSYQPLKNQLTNLLGDYSNLELTTIYETIDELVERRNAVAHGEITDDILNTNRILDMCNFIKIFSESLNNYLSNLMIKRLFEEDVETTSKNFQELHMIEIYNSKILCVKSNNLNISVGINIIIKSSNVPEFQEATIKSIQVEGETVDSVTSEQSVDIGLLLDKKIKKSNSFYIIT